MAILQYSSIITVHLDLTILFYTELKYVATKQRSDHKDRSSIEQHTVLIIFNNSQFIFTMVIISPAVVELNSSIFLRRRLPVGDSV